MAKDRSQPKLWRIGAVSRLTGVNPHILRYWESEFQILAPNRHLSKQRFYRQTDIDLILEIKRLLEEEKYTLSGVKQYLASRRVGAPAPPPPPPATKADFVHLVQEELLAIRAVLAEAAPIKGSPGAAQRALESALARPQKKT